MKNYNYKTLKSIREEQSLTQEQMGERLNMTQSNYSKLENNHKKINSVEMLSRIARVLNISEEQLKDLLTKKEEGSELGLDSNVLIETLQQKIIIRENFIECFIHFAYHKCTSKYEEGIPWEEFNEHDNDYVVNICGIKTKEEYESIGYPLTSKVSEENYQIAFEEMIDDMNIYSCFEFGLVNDRSYIEMWEVFKKKNVPKFSFDYNEGFFQTTRLEYELEKESK